MAFFKVAEGDRNQRAAIRQRLSGIEAISAKLRKDIITAWVSVWTSSTYNDIDAAPYSPTVPNYRLMDHVNDVIEVGMSLAQAAEMRWNVKVDPDELYAILALHDLDKPLLYERKADRIEKTPLYAQVPHGVVAGFLLRDLGFSDVVVATVTTHAVNAPFHGSNAEAWILHYADMFSSDKILPDANQTPFYMRH